MGWCIAHEKVALGRCPIGVGGGNEKRRRRMCDLIVPFRNDVDVNALSGHAQIETLLLRAAGGRVGEIGSVSDIAKALVAALGEFLLELGKVDAGLKTARGVRFALVF